MAYSTEVTLNSSVDFTRALNKAYHPTDGGGAADTFTYICEAVVIPIIFLVGIITNCFSLVILPKSSIAATFKNCLIALTITDLCAGITGFTQMMVEVIAFQGQIEWGHYDDRAVASFSLYYIFSWFICSSAAIVIAIVVIRHYTIRKPVAAKFKITPSCAKYACLTLVLVTFVLYIPTSLNILWQSCYKDTKVGVCVWVNRNIPQLTSITTTYLVSLTVLYGPILVVVYIGCMIGIRVNLRRTERMLQHLQETKQNGDRRDMANRHKTTQKITKTLLLIILLDTICCIPLCIQAFSLLIAPTETVFSATNTAYIVFDSIAEVFLVLRQAYNFWLYAYSHRSFRRRAKALVCCMFSTRHREEWLSPISTTHIARSPGRIGSTTSYRLQSVDLETDVTWVKHKGEERNVLNGNGFKKASVRSTNL